MCVPRMPSWSDLPLDHQAPPVVCPIAVNPSHHWIHYYVHRAGRNVEHKIDAATGHTTSDMVDASGLTVRLRFVVPALQ